MRERGIPERTMGTAAWVRHLKSTTPCMDCGQSYPFYVMQFDHRPNEIKSFEISRARRHTREEVLAEIAKCDLVCANCHHIRTYDRVIRRPKIINLKRCARCGAMYAGPYRGHADDPEHVRSLRTVRGAA